MSSDGEVRFLPKEQYDLMVARIVYLEAFVASAVEVYCKVANAGALAFTEDLLTLNSKNIDSIIKPIKEERDGQTYVGFELIRDIKVNVDDNISED